MALVSNTLPTGAILVVLILIFEPISGAHFNPEGRAPQDPKVKVRRVTGGARRQRTLASNSAVGRTQFLPLPEVRILSPQPASGVSPLGFQVFGGKKNPDAKPRRGKSITIGFCRSE